MSKTSPVSHIPVLSTMKTLFKSAVQKSYRFEGIVSHHASSEMCKETCLRLFEQELRVAATTAFSFAAMMRSALSMFVGKSVLGLAIWPLWARGTGGGLALMAIVHQP